MLVVYHKFFVGWKSVWSTLNLIMRICVRPTIIGLFIVVVWFSPFIGSDGILCPRTSILACTLSNWRHTNKAQLPSRAATLYNSSSSTSTLNNPISVRRKISVEIISVVHTNSVVQLEWTWLQNPESSWRLPTNTLNMSWTPTLVF